MKIYTPIPDRRSEEILNILKQHAEVVIAKTRPTQEEFEEIIKDYDGVMIGVYHHINQKVLENSNLKFVGLMAKGNSNIDKDACKKHNVPVFYTPEANISSVAEHVMALILTLSKNIITVNQKIREEKFHEYKYTTFDIREKTLGIIGAGPIAQQVIKRAKSFDMNIICYTPHPENHQDLDVEFTTLENLLKNSDFVSINIPLNKETENFISKKELNLMKSTAYLINTSKGKVVNESDLVEILKNNQIAGAGIDVFEEEPTHNKELFALDNAILTPHVAGVSSEAVNRMEEHLIEDIITFLENKEPKYRLV